jgi:hypothetical protein
MQPASEKLRAPNVQICCFSRKVMPFWWCKLFAPQWINLTN